MQGLLLSVKDILGMMMVAALVVAVVSAFIPFHKAVRVKVVKTGEDMGMTDSIYLSYSFAVTVWLSADCCQIGIIPEKEEILTVILAVFRNLCIFAVPNEYGAHSSVG